MDHSTIFRPIFDADLTEQAILFALLNKGKTIINNPNTDALILSWQTLLTKWGIPNHVTSNQLIIISPGRDILRSRLKNDDSNTINLTRFPQLAAPVIALFSGLDIPKTVIVNITDSLVRLIDALTNNGAHIKLNITKQQLVIAQGIQSHFLSVTLHKLDSSTKNWFLFTGIVAQQTVMVFDKFRLATPVEKFSDYFNLQKIIQEDMLIIRSQTFYDADHQIIIPMQSQALMTNLCLLALNNLGTSELIATNPISPTTLPIITLLRRIGLQITQLNLSNVLITRTVMPQPIHASLVTWSSFMPVLPSFILFLASIPGISHLTDLEKFTTDTQAEIRQKIKSLQDHGVPVSVNIDTITINGRNDFKIDQTLIADICFE